MQVAAKPSDRARSLSFGRVASHDRRRYFSESRMSEVVLDTSAQKVSSKQVCNVVTNSDTQVTTNVNKSETVPCGKGGSDLTVTESGNNDLGNRNKPEKLEDMKSLKSETKEVKDAQSVSVIAQKSKETKVQSTDDKSRPSSKSGNDVKRERTNSRSEDTRKHSSSSSHRDGQHYCGICGDRFRRVYRLLDHLYNNHKVCIVYCLAFILFFCYSVTVKWSLP